MGDKIPQVIHQTYSIGRDDERFPKELQANINKIQKLNPDWEYRYYDNDDRNHYISNHFPKLLNIYQKINPKYRAAKADFFRYLVIYNEGGVYLDVKANTAAPLSNLIKENDKYILSHWPQDDTKHWLGKHPGITNSIGELQQWHIAAVSGHPFLKSVIENVCHNINHYNPMIHDYGSWGVFNLTGPIAYTEAIYPLLEQYPHRLEYGHTDIGLSPTCLNETIGHHKIFQGKHYSKLEESITKQPPHKQFLFCLSRPLIKFLKSRYKK